MDQSTIQSVARESLSGVIEQGAQLYKRERMLWRLFDKYSDLSAFRTTPEPQLTQNIIADLEKGVARELNRRGSWAFDANRLIGLRQALLAETRHLEAMETHS